MTNSPRLRPGLALAALLFSLASTAFAQGQGATAPTARDAGQSPSAPPSRLAYVDTDDLAQRGVRLGADGLTKDDLKTFGGELKVELFDMAKLKGAVFIGDDALDVTDIFHDAVKARPSRSARPKAPAVTIPDAKVALINTDTFAHPGAGVTRLTDAFEAIEREFSERKPGRADREKRLMEMTGPIYEDIGKALSKFCKLHGISLVFDVSRVKVKDKLPPFDVRLPAGAPDVTADFVSAFNRGALKP